MKNFTLKHLSSLGLLIVSQFAFAQQNRLYYYDALFLMKNKEYVGLADSLINLDLKHS
jgi:ABC-type enterochelin transport system ATPase subunit